MSTWDERIVQIIPAQPGWVVSTVTSKDRPIIAWALVEQIINERRDDLSDADGEDEPPADKRRRDVLPVSIDECGEAPELVTCPMSTRYVGTMGTER